MVEQIYIVIQEGVYRHDIKGAYFEQSDAIDRAIERIKQEEDDYHRYIVLKCVMGKPIDDAELVMEVSCSIDLDKQKIIYKKSKGDLTREEQERRRKDATCNIAVTLDFK